MKKRLSSYNETQGSLPPLDIPENTEVGLKIIFMSVILQNTTVFELKSSLITQFHTLLMINCSSAEVQMS